MMALLQRNDVVFQKGNFMISVLEYLERTAERCPQKTAVIDEHGSITYAQWVKSAQRIGSTLCILGGCGEGKPVPVLMEKGIAALQSFFGIAYAGSFYVLMNPQLPKSRLQEMLKILEAETLITDTSHRALARELGAARILLVEELLNLPADPVRLQRVRRQVTDVYPLYANFTSGSTGIPKAVLVGHRSVIDFTDVFTDLFHMDETDVIGNQAPFDFDVSVKDIYSAVAVGATLVIIPRHLFSSPANLLDFICEHRITTMIWAVSALCLITSFHGLDYRVPETVKKILFSGEVMPEKHLKLWMKYLPGTEFVNLYGPTEITCNCTYHRIDRNRDYEGRIPVGRAFPNEKVFLLNEKNQLVTKAGEVGEICVSGTALALGYYGNREQTAGSFVQNPLNDKYYERIYRSGDLGYFNEQGELFFCGRKDFQIKHMGHRVELEEIEALMMKVPGVSRACCVFDRNRSRLYAAYMGEVPEKELFGEISVRLPVFMVPRKLIRMDQFPMSKNGKIDRARVLEMLTAVGRTEKKKQEGSV